MDEILAVKWPWSMLPLDFADDYIAHLQEHIGPLHPLYGKKVFPSCIREDTQELIVQYDVDDDGTYAIVNFSRTQVVGGEEMPTTEMLCSREQLIARFAEDQLLAKKTRSLAEGPGD
jgi:hypothetical protein